MNDLISREEARNLMYHKQEPLTEYDLDSLPTIEAEIVRHGHWIELDIADYACSECGFRFTSGDKIELFKFCRCGARMDGE